MTPRTSGCGRPTSPWSSWAIPGRSTRVPREPAADPAIPWPRGPGAGGELPLARARLRLLTSGSDGSGRDPLRPGRAPDLAAACVHRGRRGDRLFHSAGQPTRCNVRGLCRRWLAEETPRRASRHDLIPSLDPLRPAGLRAGLGRARNAGRGLSQPARPQGRGDAQVEKGHVPRFGLRLEETTYKFNYHSLTYH